MELKSNNLIGGKSRFYTDTGADISIIKQGCVKVSTPIDNSRIVAITGVTPGECITLGRIDVQLQGLLCELHVVPDDFPIDTDGLIGWDTLTRYGGQVNAGSRCLEFRVIAVPFIEQERFIIPARTRQIIYARVKGNDSAGFVPLQDLGPGILFGNFVAVNQNGKAFAECLNITDEPVEIKPPLVSLEPCETVMERDEIF